MRACNPRDNGSSSSTTTRASDRVRIVLIVVSMEAIINERGSPTMSIDEPSRSRDDRMIRLTVEDEEDTKAATIRTTDAATFTKPLNSNKAIVRIMQAILLQVILLTATTAAACLLRGLAITTMPRGFHDPQQQPPQQRAARSMRQHQDITTILRRQVDPWCRRRRRHYPGAATKHGNWKRP